MKIEKFILKNKKPIIIGGVLAIGAIAAYYMFRKKDAAGEIIVKNGISWPLKRKAGSLTTPEEQEVIKDLQRHLNNYKISYVDPPLVVDGYFGPKTEAQIELFYGTKTVPYSLYKEIMS